MARFLSVSGGALALVAGLTLGASQVQADSGYGYGYGYGYGGSSGCYSGSYSSSYSSSYGGGYGGGYSTYYRPAPRPYYARPVPVYSYRYAPPVVQRRTTYYRRTYSSPTYRYYSRPTYYPTYRRSYSSYGGYGSYGRSYGGSRFSIGFGYGRGYSGHSRYSGGHMSFGYRR